MRFVLTLSYDGTHYHGWQNQEKVSSIQGVVEAALSKVANHSVDVVCAGRTDKGVHALGQVAHFDSNAERDLHGWLLGINTYLPADIRVEAITSIQEDFHARFSAIARRYRYVIYNNRIPSALLRNQTSWFRFPLDITLMREAAQHLIGEHDFSSYRAVECQARSPIRNVQELTLQQKGKFIFIDIKANGFLHHMVRNIAGVLLAIGSNKQNPIWAKEVLEARDRRAGSITANASGLYFMEAIYPERFGLSNDANQWLFA